MGIRFWETRPRQIFGISLVSLFLFAPVAPPQETASEAEQPPPEDLVLRGGDEEEILEGGEGNDILDGAGGPDWLYGEAGDDILRGGAGNDMLDGGPGVDSLEGGADDDVVDGGEGNDRLGGGEGNDTLDGRDGEDILEGDDGDDDLNGGDHADILHGGAGNDTLNGGDDPDNLDGGADDDWLFGRDGADVLSGGPGNDYLEGGDAADTLLGGFNDDELHGGDGDDFLRGDAGDDVLTGLIGEDRLDGGPGNDLLRAGADDDVLLGGTGDDRLFGGAGTDVVMAGDGDDLIVIRVGDVAPGANETVAAGAGVDTLLLNGIAATDLTLTKEVAASQPPAEQGAAAAMEQAMGETGGDAAEAAAAAAQEDTAAQEAETPPSRDYVINDRSTGGTYTVSGVERILYEHYLTALGGAAASSPTVLLTNPSADNPTQGVIEFFDPDGVPAPVSVDGEAAAESAEINVSPLGTRELTLDVDEGTRVSARLVVDGPLTAAARSAVSGSDMTWIAETGLGDWFLIPFSNDPDSGVNLGLSLVNGSLPGTIHPMLAPEIDSVEVVLPARGSATMFYDEMFPELRIFQGALLVEGAEIGGIGLRRSRDGGVASFPVFPVRRPQNVEQTLSPAARSKYFARYRAGAGTSTSLHLSNFGGPAAGEVAFFDADGNEMEVELEGRGTVARVPFQIFQGQGGSFVAVPEGPEAIGSVQVTVNEGAIGGGVLFTESPDGGFLGAGGSTALDSFVAPVRRSSALSQETEVTVASTGAAVTVELTLHGADGNAAEGGDGRIEVPANGHVVATLDQVFPSAATSDFKGTITGRAAGGTIAVLVVLRDGETGAQAPMPVASIQ